MPLILIIAGWLLLSAIIGSLGSGRNIGFGGAFFLSLILSPILGLIITLLSAEKIDINSPHYVAPVQPQPSLTIAEQLEKFAAMLETGAITQDEFNQLKAKLIQ